MTTRSNSAVVSGRGGSRRDPTAAAAAFFSSSVRRRAWGMVVLVVCAGRPSALVLPVVQGSTARTRNTATTPGLLPAVPTVAHASS